MAVAGVALGLAGCAQRRDDGFDLRAAVEARRYAVGGVAGGEGSTGLRFASAPALRELEVDHERRPVVVTTVAGWSWHGRVPPRAQLHAGVQLAPNAWRLVRRLEAVVELRAGGGREVLQVARTDDRTGLRWLDLTADLGRYAGREVTLRLSANLTRLPPRWRRSGLVAWGPVTLGAADSPAPGGRPNIIFILVDTLRWDRLTPYGYWRETSPQIARRLAAAGTVVEEAYSQAPWTLPSVVSFMTGRYPGELLGTDIAAYGIPAGVETLAERLAKLGYDTAGFLANPALHVGAGFERGFHTFYAPTDSEWIRKHADDLNRHAVPWLAAAHRRPFFLYLHYVDPHDPYENPEIAGNRSPFESPYAGPVAGDWVHGIYAGHIKLTDPARDVAHLSALYDSEVHYADRYIGELLATLGPQALAGTLFVLTADHGEELDDHGGWKHGQTLYEEQIHVPLIWRWDRHIPAGRRLAGTVRLLDLMPTLLAAAGGPTSPGNPDPSDRGDPNVEGIDLLPALTGSAPLPQRPAFAEGLAGGPLRAAAIVGKLKLVLFNRQEPFRPANELQDHLWHQDLSRLQRWELYDLASDPRERRNPAAPRGDDKAPAHANAMALLDMAIERRLDLSLPGLRIHAAGVPPGSRLRGRIVFQRPPPGWVPYFLAAEDKVQLAGTQLSFDLTGDEIEKGLRIEGDFGGLAAVSAALDGAPLPASRISIGDGGPYTGGAVEEARLRSRRWPSGASLKLWVHDATGEVARRTTHDAETERQLRALGYIQ
jgi:arylsulfatase A-like enzyme